MCELHVGSSAMLKRMHKRIKGLNVDSMHIAMVSMLPTLLTFPAPFPTCDLPPFYVLPHRSACGHCSSSCPCTPHS